jgi:septum formation protein
MRKLSDQEIEGYLDSGFWAGKAGAYGIQEIGDRFVEHVEGSFSNVMGLPMELLDRMLRQAGLAAGDRR